MPRRRAGPTKSTQDPTLPKYSIAVAADLSGVPQQQLRRMEESGLLSPNRTDGNTRRYSDGDLTQIAEIADLAEAGINAAGIRHILALRTELASLRADLAALRAENDALRRSLAHDGSSEPGPR